MSNIIYVYELNEIKANYEKAISSAPIHTIEYKSKFHGKANELIEEESFMATSLNPSVIELSNINELSSGFKEVAIEDGDEINYQTSNIDSKSRAVIKHNVNTSTFSRKPQ